MKTYIITLVAILAVATQSFAAYGSHRRHRPRGFELAAKGARRTHLVPSRPRPV